MEKIGELHGHKSPVNRIAITGDRLFSAGDDENVIVWSLEVKNLFFLLIPKTGKILTSISHPSFVRSIAVIGDDLYTASEDKTVRRYDLKTGALVLSRKLNTTEPVVRAYDNSLYIYLDNELHVSSPQVLSRHIVTFDSLNSSELSPKVITRQRS